MSKRKFTVNITTTGPPPEESLTEVLDLLSQAYIRYRKRAASRERGGKDNPLHHQSGFQLEIPLDHVSHRGNVRTEI